MTVFEINNRIEESFNPTIDKYAMYLRKSRADIEAEKDGEGETLARHKKILTELAVRKGLYVEKIYEEVVSGETIEARTEIKRLIQDCYAGKYRGIIIIDISRLSRGNQGDAQTILDCLKFSNMNRGVLVVTPSKTYDIAHNHDDEEYMEFELFMSRREFNMIKRRLDRGKIQAVVEGNYIGSYRPYGYDIVKSRKSRYLVPNKDEAPYVKMIFDMAIGDNASLDSVVNRLHALGVPGPRGGKWSTPTIRQLLRNPVYIGKIKWRERVKLKTMDEDGEVKTKLVRYTDQYMEYDGKHDGIVDPELFARAVKRFPNPRLKRKHYLVNSLAGILKCQKCGMTMRYKPFPNGKHRVTHDGKKYGCGVKSALLSDVMDALKYALKLHIEDFEAKISSNDLTNEEDVKKEISIIQTELRKIESRKSKLFDGWESGAITDNEFVERKAVLSERIENMKNQILELESSIPEEIDYQDKIVSLHQVIDLLGDSTINANDMNLFLKKVIERIDFSRENTNEFILDVYLN